MQLTPDTDSSVNDRSTSRERIFVRTNNKNRFQKRVIYDSGWDLVEYEGLPAGFEPGANVFEQRPGFSRSDRKYTGVMVVDASEPLGDRLLRMGGRGSR